MSLPFCDVSFTADKKRGQRQPVDVRILQREYAHDTAVIRMPWEKKNQKKYAHGAPVVMRYGWAPDDVDYFFGYVDHTKVHDQQSTHRQLDIYCIGASYRFRAIRMRSFRAVTAMQAAARIAREHRFSLLTQAYPRRFPVLVQHGRSDWAFLVSLAKRIGFTLYCHKTDLALVRRAVDPNPKRPPTFRLRPGRWNQRATVYSIRHAVGDSVPGTERRQQLVMGISDDGKLIQAVASPSTSGAGTSELPAPTWFRKVSTPVHSALEAQQTVQGAADAHRFAVKADAVLSGSPKVHQGTTIRIVATDADSDGLWWVSQAEHHITLQDYRIKAVLERDSVGDKLATETPAESDSGKPVVLTDCDVSVDTVLAPAPDTVYAPLDACMPVEELDQPDVLQPVSSTVAAVFSSPARRRMAAQRPTRTTPNRKLADRLDAWYASSFVVRTKGS